MSPGGLPGDPAGDREPAEEALRSGPDDGEPGGTAPPGRLPVDAVPPLQTRLPRWRKAVSAGGARINALSYLPRWLILGSMIGVIAGLGAVLFYAALTEATRLFLGLLAGYSPPLPAGEGGGAGTGHYVRWWAIPLVVTLGGLLAGFVVFTWAPEAEGHGTDAAIDAVHHNPRGIRLRAVVVKIIASAITIGSGGSGGREGPTAQISAGFGSLLARLLDLSPEDGRIAVSVGIGSGIGAIFSAPLGGAVLAADVVYRDDFEFSALLPGTFASIIAYAIFGGVFGYRPLFAIPGYHFDQPIQLLWFAIIGVLAGGIGLLYSKGFYGMVSLSARLPFTRKLRPALGGLAVGLIALWLPEVLGTGYGWVQEALSNQLLRTPIYIVLLLPFARIVATALSIGTGGSGGVFGPGMVIGAFTGLAVWRLLEPVAPGVGHDPAPFVVVGMMAVFGGISRAPLAVMLMVAQMTGNISLLAPAMVAVAAAWFIVGRADDTIYRAQLANRSDSASGRLEAGMPALGTLDVSAVMSVPRLVLRDDTAGDRALALLRQHRLPGAPVVDARGTYLGTVETAQLAARADGGPVGPVGPVGRLLDVTTSTVAASAALGAGLNALVQAGGQWLTVTNGDRQVVGILSLGDLVRGYQELMGASLGRFGLVGADAVALEEQVGKGSPLAGRAVGDGRLPRGCVIVTIERDGVRQPVHGSSVIEAGDVLSMFTGPAEADRVRALVRGGAPPEAPGLHGETQMV
jgi:CIC family chloride channel protein